MGRGKLAQCTYANELTYDLKELTSSPFERHVKSCQNVFVRRTYLLDLCLYSLISVGFRLLYNKERLKATACQHCAGVLAGAHVRRGGGQTYFWGVRLYTLVCIGFWALHNKCHAMFS